MHVLDFSLLPAVIPDVTKKRRRKYDAQHFSAVIIICLTTSKVAWWWTITSLFHCCIIFLELLFLKVSNCLVLLLFISKQILLTE